MEFLNVIDPLTNPSAWRQTRRRLPCDLPSLPGFGFSDKPTDTSWDVLRIAKAWVVLMQRLGYKR